MDPVGFSVGIIGLTGLVSTAIQCFTIFRGMRAFGRDQEILCTKLDIEKASLIQWAEQVGLLRRHRSEDGRRHLFSPFVDKTIHRVLREIVLLLNDGHKLQRKYGLMPVDESQANFRTDVVSRHRMRQLGLHSGSDSEDDSPNGRQKVGYTKKFVWSIHEKNEFNELITQLEYFIGKLYQMIPRVEQVKMVNEDLSHVRDDQRTLRLIEAAASSSHKDWSDLASQFAFDTETAVSTNGTYIEEDRGRSKRRSSGGASGSGTRRRRRSRSRYDEYSPDRRGDDSTYYHQQPSYRSSAGSTLYDMFSDIVRAGHRPISTFRYSSDLY